MNIEINGESAMKSFGKLLGRALKGGECIELVGDVGAGKTTLTKGIAIGLDIAETVQSPTFTINRVYKGRNDIRLSHYDFYRLSDAGIMADELSESLSESATVIVIEWGDVVASVLPDDHLRITISSPDADIRSLRLEPKGERALRLIEEVA